MFMKNIFKYEENVKMVHCTSKLALKKWKERLL
jgi:hypothetical protein